MKAFASLLSSKKKSSQPDPSPKTTHIPSPLPSPVYRSYFQSTSNHNKLRPESTPAPAPSLPYRPPVTPYHGRGTSFPSQENRNHLPPYQHDPNKLQSGTTRYQTPPSSISPPHGRVCMPLGQLRFHKSLVALESSDQRVSMMTDEDDPFAAPSRAIPSHGPCEPLRSGQSLSLPVPQPLSNVHDWRSELNGVSPLAMKTRPFVHDAPAPSHDGGTYSNSELLQRRRRAKSVGASHAPSHAQSDFRLHNLKLSTQTPAVPQIPSQYAPSRIQMDKQLPTPATPITPAPSARSSTFSNSSIGSERRLRAKKSMPRLEGLWQEFLRDADEDVQSLSRSNGIEEAGPPVPSKKEITPMVSTRPRGKTLPASIVLHGGLLSPGPLTPLRTEALGVISPVSGTLQTDAPQVQEFKVPSITATDYETPLPVINLTESTTVSRCRI